MGVLKDAHQVLRFVWRHPANRERRLHAVGRAVRFQVRGRLGLPTVTPIGTGARLWAEIHQSGASKVVYANPPDWAEMRVWRSILRPDSLFIDVGSNIGAYALWAAESGAEVIAVEPDADAAARLRRNIALNGFPIEVLNCALAAEPGTMSLTVGRDCTNHLVMNGSEQGRAVTTRTLDDIIGDRYVTGVKIDVEGAERLVLDGAERALAERRIRVLQLEWNEQSRSTLGEDREPVAATLRRHGYHLTRPDADGRLVPTDPSGYGEDLFAVVDGADLHAGAPGG
ncbi:FkbM family methyltransferase [Micromonospora halophytica]|uniref:Methyltransferase, FkbM family n=1 Tax=Micromonospora halophytica TaxID=47864 RepID=A0A1C5IR94_9ACTN|nr:FkbM family methyltransferase [Micromonospora halophytica]SCG60868.1 methyltransferase, FkbM family [Micromonospora halophytica]